MRRTMMNLVVMASNFLLALLLVRVESQGVPVCWINEVHYNPLILKSKQYIEVACLRIVKPGGWQVSVYSGLRRAETATLRLDSAQMVNNTGTGIILYTLQQRLSNLKTGIALVDQKGKLQQFISYGGSFTAANGPADGKASIDVGIKESLLPTKTSSLQLSGQGCEVQQFTWSVPSNLTMGAANQNQRFVCNPFSSFPTPDPSPHPSHKPSRRPSHKPSNLASNRPSFKPTPCPASGCATSIVGLAWTFAEFGVVRGGWSVSEDKRSVLFEADSSFNCLGTNANRQYGNATGLIKVQDYNQSMDIGISGRAEQYDYGFDTFKVYLNGVQIADCFAQGGRKLCAEPLPPVKNFLVAKPYPLDAGKIHVLKLEFDTLDENFNTGVFYQIDLTFTNRTS